MDLEKDILINLLKERGIFDFKPFVTNDLGEQLFGYCTHEDDKIIFHLCKSSLVEVPLEDLDDTANCFAIRVSDKTYSILPEQIDISETADTAWLIDCDGIIINKEVQGYRIIGDYIILSPELEMTSVGEKSVYGWNPSPKCPMFKLNSNMVKARDKVYCASTDSFHIGYSDNHYFAFGEDNGSCQAANSFLVYDDDVYLVNYYAHYQELKWVVCKYRGTDWLKENDRVLEIETGINIDLIENCKIEWCCSHNYFAITILQEKTNAKSICLSSWHWDWKKSTFNGSYYLSVQSTILCSKLIDADQQLIKVGDGANGVVVLGNDNNWSYEEPYKDGKQIVFTSGRYFIYDMYGEILADNVLKENEYAIITKSIPDKGHLITNTNDNYLLSGVLRMEDLSVVVPMQYQEIVIEATNPDLVVLMRADYWGKQRYEIYRCGKGIFPEAIPDCELSKMKSDKLILVREGNKYDIVHKGERCLPAKYDMIKEIKPNVCLLLIDGEEKQLLIIADNFLSRRYKSIKLIHGDYSRVFFIGDDSLVKIANEKEVALIEDCPSLELICSDQNGCYYIFEEDDLGFVCYSKWGDEIELEDYYSDNVDCYKIEDEDLWFVPEEGVIVDNLWKYRDNDNDSWGNYDYEEDTYYALGGTDYEQFRENGGSIDDMMDGMGF